ncbi:AAA domain-containing protein [Lentibacillus halodurans]|uniref:AAA domain-containing protein n=1 Tax=Lentibacillus halodurans TaxID=237679 RepID=A0A1I0XJM4_9BACI|nr:AAA family ATPase [Lentibacillus halodurans]SFB01225.1 AAA domain-containing protein [Lentibacillus halodurans]
MLKTITMQHVATFGDKPEHLNELKEINYIYGSNGSGKTTISEFLRNSDDPGDCRVTWKAASQGVLVYNRNFVEENFSYTDELNGIFTLGEESTELHKRKLECEKKLDDCSSVSTVAILKFLKPYKFNVSFIRCSVKRICHI